MPSSWIYETTTPAAETVLTVGELRAHLRALSTREDAYLADLIRAVTDACETYTGRAFCPRTITVYFDNLAGELFIPRAPLRAVNSIIYVDAEGDSTTLAADQYYVDKKDAPGKAGSILPAYNLSWPTCRGFRNDVAIECAVGYASAALVPEPIRQAVRVGCASLQLDRSNPAAALPMAARDLLWPYVVRIPRDPEECD